MRPGTSKAALALAALLAGCVAGPDYHVPEKAMVNAASAQGRFEGAEGPAFSDAPLPDHWWRLYRDPALDGLIEEALAANTDLRIADANLRAATEVVRQTELNRTFEPQLSTGVGLARLYATEMPATGEPSYNAAIAGALPLDLSGQIRRAIEASRADAEVVVAARDQVRVAVAGAVTRAYLATCAANIRIAAAKRVIGIQEQTHAATRKLQKYGRGTAFDTTRARAAVQQSEASLPALLAARQAALFQLATLMGRPPAEYPRAVEGCAALPAIVG
ncbi:MAG: TolC family protein, partial [Sphingomonas bacterium]